MSNLLYIPFLVYRIPGSYQAVVALVILKVIMVPVVVGQVYIALPGKKEPLNIVPIDHIAAILALESRRTSCTVQRAKLGAVGCIKVADTTTVKEVNAVRQR